MAYAKICRVWAQSCETKLPGKRKYARRLEVMRVVYLDMLDMSEHVWTCPDTVDTGALHAKICSGDLSGSGLRKYALRQNHTIPVCRGCVVRQSVAERP